MPFQRAPTLGGECYRSRRDDHMERDGLPRFNGHPPLGVNATSGEDAGVVLRRLLVSTGTHPWG